MRHEINNKIYLFEFSENLDYYLSGLVCRDDANRNLTPDISAFDTSAVN